MRKELGTRSQEPGVRFIVIASRHQPLVGHIHDDDTPTVVIPGQSKTEHGIQKQRWNGSRIQAFGLLWDDGRDASFHIYQRFSVVETRNDNCTFEEVML